MPGKKHDKGKPPLNLLPGHSLLAISRVMAHGAKKYDEHNWRGGITYSRLMGAILRHALAFNEGEDLDWETGESHIAHLATEALFLLEFIETSQTHLDNRWRRPLKKKKGGRP